MNRIEERMVTVKITMVYERAVVDTDLLLRLNNVNNYFIQGVLDDMLGAGWRKNVLSVRASVPGAVGDMFIYQKGAK